MKTFLLKQLLCFLLVVGTLSVHAQISTNNFTIFPASQPSFSPTGKFVALGESGGVVGPTANGCDLYGFRAQVPSFIQTIPPSIPPISVSLGVERSVPSGGPFFFPTIVPTLSVSAGGLLIKEQNSSSAPGCGTLLGSFNEVTSSNNVFTILGSATATGGSWNPSDRILKRDIETIKNPMDIINGLTGYTYEYRTEERPELRLPQGVQYGFVTQEVEKVMPTAVRQADGMGDKPLDFQVMEYRAIIPVLTEAVKQQQNNINDLEQKNLELEEQNTALQSTITTLEEQDADLKRENTALVETVDNLEARLARLEALLLQDGASSSTPSNGLDNFDAVRLGQNRPNPANGNTSIDYTLPKEMTNAFLVVVDLNGRQIASQAINDPSGVVELNTSTWAPGAYVYSIVVDERVLARKKLLVK